jgi:peptidoglycan hydrolase-like protein with peptidoglycan-binding domain
MSVQKDAQLTPDGIVGPATWRELDKAVQARAA